MAKVVDARSSGSRHIVDLPITKLFSKQGLRYARVPTEDCEQGFRDIPLNTGRRSGVLKLVGQFACVGCFLAGRKCGPTLLIAFIIYIYFSGFWAFSIILATSMRALYNLCDTLLYHPEQPETSRSHVVLPSTLNLPFEEVAIKTSDSVCLHGFLIKQADFESAPTVLYLHGNAGNIGHRLPHAQEMYHANKVNFLLLEYRGYGRSEGSPSENGLYKDAQAGIEYLFNHPQINKKLVMIFGRSLGGAVAIHLASNQKYSSRLAGLILENTFTSIPSLTKVIIPYKAIRYVPRVFYKNVFASEDRISRVQCPVLFVSGLADTLIPPTMMRTLYSKCGSNFKLLATFESGNHNQTWQCKGYLKICRDFIETIKKEVDEDMGPERTVWPINKQNIHVIADVI